MFLVCLWFCGLRTERMASFRMLITCPPSSIVLVLRPKPPKTLGGFVVASVLFGWSIWELRRSTYDTAENLKIYQSMAEYQKDFAIQLRNGFEDFRGRNSEKHLLSKLCLVKSDCLLAALSKAKAFFFFFADLATLSSSGPREEYKGNSI